MSTIPNQQTAPGSMENHLPANCEEMFSGAHCAGATGSLPALDAKLMELLQDKSDLRCLADTLIGRVAIIERRVWKMREMVRALKPEENA